MKRVLDEAGLEPKWLDIEITESVLIEDQEQMKARLAELRSIGSMLRLMILERAIPP